MQPRLEKYLSKIEKQLSGLPAEQREEELREIRSHLEMMIDENIKRGCVADESVAKAIEQFGAANKVARDLKRSHFNKDQHARTWLAGLVAFFILINSGYVIFGLTTALGVISPHLSFSTGFSSCVVILLSFISGWTAEWIAPKKAILALVIMNLVMWGIVILGFVIIYLWMWSMGMLSIALKSASILEAIPSLNDIMGIFILFAGAWARRRQVEHQKNQPMITVE